jgi:hypothetical protein
MYTNEREEIAAKRHKRRKKWGREEGEEKINYE